MDEKKQFEDFLPKDFFEDKTIIVTGGCGFLGSWICNIVHAYGAKIFCVDDLSTSQEKTLSQLQTLENFTFLEKEVQKISLDDLPKDADAVFHFASRASPENYRLFPIETLESNSTGTQKILEYCRKYDCLSIFASTSEIYGNPTVVPTPETYYGYVNTMGERSCYDEGKRFAESMIYAFNQKYQLDTRIIRIFNTYGPGLRPDGNYGRALPRFILQCLKNDPVTIFGDGKQTRSFNYVTDTIAGIWAIINNKSFNSIPVNVGNQKELTILELAQTIKSITKSNSEISFLAPASDDPQRRCPDTTRVCKTGWKPIVPLEEGLEKTIEWIKKIEN